MSEMFGRPDASDWQALKAENERLLAAMERMMIGGNHVATYRTDRWPDYGATPDLAMMVLGPGREYDMWCCWNAIMCARDSLNQQQPRHIDDIIAELPTEQRTKIEERAAELISQQGQPPK